MKKEKRDYVIPFIEFAMNNCFAFYFISSKICKNPRNYIAHMDKISDKIFKFESARTSVPTRGMVIRPLDKKVNWYFQS